MSLNFRTAHLKCQETLSVFLRGLCYETLQRDTILSSTFQENKQIHPPSAPQNLRGGKVKLNVYGK